MVHGLSSCGVWTQSQREQASVVAAGKFSFPAACGILVPQPGIEPMSPAFARQIPNHWTIREIPELFENVLALNAYCLV